MTEKLILDLVKAASFAAAAASMQTGLGDNEGADRAAVSAMRKYLNEIDMDGEIKIGEGERDKAPMLYIGEKVGTGKGEKIDIALDPLEGTSICANYAEGALSVIAAAPAGKMLHAPDIYMEKIAIGKDLPENIVDLDEDSVTNLKNLAKAKKCNTQDLKVIILDRPRHQELTSSLRKLGVRIKLIKDGDISAILEVAYGDADIYIGIGGAPEGVLAAAAMKAIGGQLQCRLIFSSDQEIERARLMNIKDIKAKYNPKDMVGEDSIFVATGVTDGALLKGIRKTSGKIITESLVTDSGKRIIYKLNTCYFI